MSISIAARKQKGRLLQQWVAKKIQQIFDLHEDDARSCPMGSGGEDVQLSPVARERFPYAVECKSHKAFSIYNVYDQATYHANKRDVEPLVIIKANNKRPLALVDAEHFLELSCKLKQ